MYSLRERQLCDDILSLGYEVMVQRQDFGIDNIFTPRVCLTKSRQKMF